MAVIMTCVAHDGTRRAVRHRRGADSLTDFQRDGRGGDSERDDKREHAFQHWIQYSLRRYAALPMWGRYDDGS
jgi:hypothetical protein